MQGNGLEIDSKDSISRGLEPRVFDYMFSLIRKKVNEQCFVHCSYLEIYNETIYDLVKFTFALISFGKLNNSSEKAIQIREDINGVTIENLSRETVASSAECIDLLIRGQQYRHIACTKMNMESSRSHSVFTMTIESKTRVEK